jgi:hypothetical protein
MASSLVQGLEITPFLRPGQYHVGTMSTTGLGRAVDHFSQGSLQLSPNTLLKLGAISLAILAAPFTLWGIWILVRNWGAWKVRSRRPRPHYIRTWHGWVEAGKHADQMRRRQSRKGTHWPHCIPRTTTTDYGWVFWDPWGVGQDMHERGRRKSILRYLPSWARSYGDESTTPGTILASNQLHAVEEGRMTTRSVGHDAEAGPLGVVFTRYQSRPRPRRGQDANAQLHGYVDPDFGPRDRALPIPSDSGAAGAENGCNKRGRPWRVRSYGLTAADCSSCPILPNLNKILVESDVPSETNALVLARGELHDPHSSHVTHGIPHGTFSLPAAHSLPIGSKSKHWLSDPTSWESVYSHSVTTPKLDQANDGEGLTAPVDFDDLHELGDAATHRRPAGSDGQAVDFADRKSLVQWFRERLHVRMKPLNLSPYESVGREYSGTSGRPTSPTMSWVVRGAPMLTSISRFGGEGGEEKPMRRTGVIDRSTWSSQSLDLVSPDETRNLVTDERKPTISLDSSGSTTGPSSSDSTFHENSAPGQVSLIASFLPHHKVSGKLVRQWSTFPTRRIKVCITI